MVKYDWNTFRNYVAFLAGELAPGTRHPHHDSEWSSCYHDAFLPWGHYHNNIVLFYHDSPITRSHFMDPTDRAIKGFCCTCICVMSVWKNDTNCSDNFMFLLKKLACKELTSHFLSTTMMQLLLRPEHVKMTQNLPQKLSYTITIGSETRHILIQRATNDTLLVHQREITQYRNSSPQWLDNLPFHTMRPEQNGCHFAN